MEKVKAGPVATWPLHANRQATVMATALKRSGGDTRQALGTRRAEPAVKNGHGNGAGKAAKLASVIAQPGTELGAGGELFSDSGNAKLVYQGDGNLVLYVLRDGVTPTNSGGNWVPRWASNTWGTQPGVCAMQGDGNLVVYQGDGQPIWSSNTWGHDGAVLAVQDDENAVIYENGNAIWSTNTWIGGAVRSGFVPTSHGFRFVNFFADGYWQFGFLRFSTQGLCGGMSFTALDHYFAGKAVPATTATPSATTDPLGQYINGRQQQSVETNLGGWAVQILNPDDHALNYWATHDEWNKLKASIDAGTPVALGLGKYLNGSSSHQVVASGYREGAIERWILTYDPNRPSQESWLYLAPGALHWSDASGGDWRGYFVSSYTPQTPP